MLSLLKIKNVALIGELAVEFKNGLNLLTGETGSGKSIIVDSLGALTGARVSNDLIKEGESKAAIEGVFNLVPTESLRLKLEDSGIEFGANPDIELIVRREVAANGRNRIFVNNQLVTQGFLREIGHHLADIHGQGEQATLLDPASHLSILDGFAKLDRETGGLKKRFDEMQSVKRELEGLRADDAEKLQLLDILKFQTDEISRANVERGEDENLEDEKKRLLNIEKISTLCEEAFGLLYENDDAVASNLDKATKLAEELASFDPGVGEYMEGLENAQAVIGDLAIYIRDFRNSTEYSPSRLEEIESRLAELSSLKRKYGGTLETVLLHYEDAIRRLENIRSSEKREQELVGDLERKTTAFLDAAEALTKKRVKAARVFEKTVGGHLGTVALEKARFEVRFERRSEDRFTAEGIDEIEFYFSANPGEPPKPLAKVASGGESSRLMLILKTSSGAGAADKAVVFDEIDAGIGGRVAEAVGLKLKELSDSQQILCVTHQPQIASLADSHYLVEKSDDGKRTIVSVREIDRAERLEEIARMLAGEDITEAARENARSMLSAKA